jgi:hypothetical protein
MSKRLPVVSCSVVVEEVAFKRTAKRRRRILNLEADWNFKYTNWGLVKEEDGEKRRRKRRRRRRGRRRGRGRN